MGAYGTSQGGAWGGLEGIPPSRYFCFSVPWFVTGPFRAGGAWGGWGVPPSRFIYAIYHFGDGVNAHARTLNPQMSWTAYGPESSKI